MKARYEWTDEKIAFMKNAAEEVGFNKELAVKAASYFLPDSRILEAGCGLGYLALELAKHCQFVTACDIDDAVLNVLRENAAGQCVTNLEVICDDVYEPSRLWDAAPFDHIVFGFFGQMPQIIETAQKLCTGSVILFRKNWINHRLSDKPIKNSRLVFPDDCAWLDTRGIPYQSESFAIDMGQPFRCLDEAVRFFNIYNRNDSADGYQTADVREKLIETGSENYPWYLPMTGEVGLIVIPVSGMSASENEP